VGASVAVAVGIGEGVTVGLDVGVVVDTGVGVCPGISAAIMVREWVPADKVVLLIDFMSISSPLPVSRSRIFAGTVPTSHVSKICSTFDSRYNDH